MKPRHNETCLQALSLNPYTKKDILLSQLTGKVNWQLQVFRSRVQIKVVYLIKSAGIINIRLNTGVLLWGHTKSTSGKPILYGKLLLGPLEPSELLLAP